MKLLKIEKYCTYHQVYLRSSLRMPDWLMVPAKEKNRCFTLSITTKVLSEHHR